MEIIFEHYFDANKDGSFSKDELDTVIYDMCTKV